VDAQWLQVLPWLSQLLARGWTMYFFHTQSGGTVVAAARYWQEEGWVDVVVIRNQDDGVAYSLCQYEEIDIFAPDVVQWSFQGQVSHAVRSALRLGAPAHRKNRDAIHPAPDFCRLAREDRLSPLTNAD